MLMNLSTTAIIATLLLLGCAVVAWQLARGVRIWGRLGGDRLVTCTATGSPAVVRIDARGAAVGSLICRTPKADIAECSLWATGGSCDLGCTVEALSPESTTGRIASRWFDKKICVYCAKPIAARSVGHHPALLGPTVERANGPMCPLSVCWNRYGRICRCAGIATSRRRSGASIRSGSPIARCRRTGEELVEDAAFREVCNSEHSRVGPRAYSRTADRFLPPALPLAMTEEG